MMERLAFTTRHLDARSPLGEDDIETFRQKIQRVTSIQSLLGIEGDEVKMLIYRRYAKRHFPGTTFRRDRDATDRHSGHAQVNIMLNHGNNLAYAMAAGALWSIGLPSQFPLIHGQTRDGGLIFDAADLIKDGIVAPWAFEMHDQPTREAMSELRYRLKKTRADEFIIDSMKALAMDTSS
jgi:CRISPR-associated protein Cas1